MATLYITEFNQVEMTDGGRLAQIATQPPIAEQTVTISGSSTASVPFNAKTQYVRLHTDSICSIEFGLTPVATAANARMAASTTEYFGVPKGLSYEVAVISNT